MISGRRFPLTNASKILIAKSGQQIKAGGTSIDILFPLENLAGKEAEKTANSTSIVHRVVYGRKSFLFTGDVGFTEENTLANSYELTDLKSDVLKIAHHGSKYSTSNLFLENVKPEFAVIEVGKNSYGHPTEEVLQRLQNYDIKIFRTDTDKDVQMASDGKNIIIK